jgi:hypothetical protein
VSSYYIAPPTVQNNEVVEKELDEIHLFDTASERVDILRNELNRLCQLYYSGMFFSLFPIFPDPRNIEGSLIFCVCTEHAFDISLKFAFSFPSSRPSAEQLEVDFKFNLCRRYPDRVLFISKDDSSIFCIRCMVTDCWIPQHECIASRLVSRKNRDRDEMNDDFSVGPDGCTGDQSGILWAQGIETAFSNNGVCLMYDPLVQKWKFFVLNPQLSDRTICFSSNRVVRFRDVDGKPLNFGGSGLPSLKLLMFHAKNAISDARDMIESGEWSRPSHWGTVETLNSMVDDSEHRFYQGSEHVNHWQRSQAEFAQPAAQQNNVRSVAKVRGLRKGAPHTGSSPSPANTVFSAPPLQVDRTASAASSDSESSDTAAVKSKYVEFYARIKVLQSQSKFVKAATSQLAAGATIHNAVVAPLNVVSKSNRSRSTSLSQNPRHGPAQLTRPGTDLANTTNPAPAQLLVPHRPNSGNVASRGGLMSPTVSSTMRSAPLRRPVASGSSTQKPQANGKMSFQK